MEKRDIFMIIATIAAVGLIAGFVTFAGDGTSSDGKELVGEWKAYHAVGYDEGGNYVTITDPVLLEKYNFEIIWASNGMYSATFDTEKFQGTYVNGMINTMFINDLSTTSLRGTLINDTLFVNTLVCTNSGATSVMGITYNHNGMMPQIDESDKPAAVTIPESWIMDSGVSFDGTSINLAGDNLTITKQSWPLLCGTMDQQVGTEIVSKDIKAIATPVPSGGTEQPKMTMYRAVDETGLLWTMLYDSDINSLRMTAAYKSDITIGTTATYRSYTIPDTGDVPILNYRVYVGMTWRCDTVNTIDVNGNPIKADYPIELSITSQNGILISGTVTMDGHIADYSAVVNNYGWTFADYSSSEFKGFGSVTVSSDMSSLFVRNLYTMPSGAGMDSLNAMTYTLERVESAASIALLGEWQCQYNLHIDEDRVFKTEVRSDADLEKWDLNIQSIKGGMFIGTYGGETIVGTAPGGFFKSEAPHGATLCGSIDGDNLQVHVMTVNADGTTTISNMVYTRGQATTETAPTVKLQSDYESKYADMYDGTNIIKLGGTALKITEQQGSLFKGIMDIDLGGVLTVDVIGYIMDTGDIPLGSVIIEQDISSIRLMDGAIFMNGLTPTDNVYARLYVPVDSEPLGEPPERTSLIGVWSNVDSYEYSSNGFAYCSPVYVMEITKEDSIFVSGMLGNLPFIGISTTLDDYTSLRLYCDYGTGPLYPTLLSLHDGVGNRSSILPDLVIVSSIEKQTE